MLIRACRSKWGVAISHETAPKRYTNIVTEAQHNGQLRQVYNTRRPRFTLAMKYLR